MLTDAKCRNAACPPGKKRGRFSDSHGLYLEVSPAGSKRWFAKIYREGKESRLALGGYPAVSLAEARRARDAARLDKKRGIDPIEARKVTGSTFGEMGAQWFAKNSGAWSPTHVTRTRRLLERDLNPYLATRPMTEITPPELLGVVQRIEERGALETARRALMLARQVWGFAVAAGVAPRDITPGLMAALTPPQAAHFAAITDPGELAILLRAMRAYKGGPVVRAALQLAPLLFQRPGELRGASWGEMDLDNALWTIPAARMKRKQAGKEYGAAHLVPLPAQAVAILRALHAYTGGTGLVFPGDRQRTKAISDNSVRTALISMGYGPDRQTWHGFRATARTLLAEVLEVDPLVIEAQLAHAVRDANGRAYNRTTYIEQRRRMMQQWADYLDKLAAGD
jgi:integrase